jgi:hypothetical protein
VVTGILHHVLPNDVKWFREAIASYELGQAGNTDPQECFYRYFKDQSAIVVFDEANKYEVRIEVPAFTSRLDM